MTSIFGASVTMLGSHRLLLSVAFTLWGISLIWFSSSTVYERLAINLEGQVVSRSQGTYYGSPGKYVDYRIRQLDGMTVTYRANGNDTALSRGIPIGAYVIKKRWQLDYYVDGKRISDFPANFYFPLLMAALLLVAFGSYIFIHRPKLKPVDYSPIAWPLKTNKELHPKTIVLASKLDIDQIIDRLQLTQRSSSDIQVYLDANKFSLIRKGKIFNNAFRPQLFGKVNNTELGFTVISYRIGMNPFIKGFSWFLIVFGILFSIVFYLLVLFGTAHGVPTFFDYFFPLIWITVVGCFILLGRHLSQGDKPYLISFIQRDLEAHPFNKQIST
jgi:hypothetical protein